MHLLAIAAGAFKLWMLVDCVQRSGGSGCNNHWFWIIFLPFGDVAYFLTVKIHDFPVRSLRQPSASPQSLPIDKLRFEVQHCPSTGNKLRLAQGLYMKGEYRESKAIIEEVLSSYPDDKEALFGHGVVLCELKEYEQAKAPLLKLTSADVAFRDYQAAQYLIRVYTALGADDEVFTLSEQLYKKSLTLEHALLYSKSLVRAGRSSEAKKLLERSLLEYDHSPRFVQRSQRSFAKASRLYLKQELQQA